MAQWPRATLLLSETMDNPISAGSQVASVLSPLHHFLRFSVRHLRSDFVPSHSIKDVGWTLTCPTQ